MRKVIKEQMEIGETHISNIELDINSRDEIPKVLMGLQHIYGTESLREAVFDILERLVPKENHERDTITR